MDQAPQVARETVPVLLKFADAYQTKGQTPLGAHTNQLIQITIKVSGIIDFRKPNYPPGETPPTNPSKLPGDSGWRDPHPSGDQHNIGARRGPWSALCKMPRTGVRKHKFPKKPQKYQDPRKDPRVTLKALDFLQEAWLPTDMLKALDFLQEAWLPKNDTPPISDGTNRDQVICTCIRGIRSDGVRAIMPEPCPWRKGARAFHGFPLQGPSA